MKILEMKYIMMKRFMNDGDMKIFIVAAICVGDLGWDILNLYL